MLQKYQKITIYLTRFVLLLLITFCWMVVEPTKAAVTLTYFRALGEDQRVLVQWETATELNNAGFFVLRDHNKFGAYTRISDFIPAKGEGLIGAEYVYIDDDVVNGVTYWYKLEALDYSQISEFHGPVYATPGVAPSPTLTNTRTPTRTISPNNHTATPTKTGTIRVDTPTRTRTSTAQPTRTTVPTSTILQPYPGPATSTPMVTLNLTEQSGIPEFTIEVSGTNLTSKSTATLIPLPEFTLQFPQENEVDEVKVEVYEDRDSTRSVENVEPDTIATDHVLIIGSILILWIVLAGWVYFTIRNI